MIEVKCSCGHKYRVPEQYTGKKVRCKKCNGYFTIQAPEDLHVHPNGSGQYRTQELQPETEVTSEIPKWVWGLFSLMGILFCAVLVWTFFFRDTWEINHTKELSMLISDVRASLDEGNYDSASKDFLTLKALIGEREIINDTLKGQIQYLSADFKTLENTVMEERGRQAELARLELAKQKAAEEEQLRQKRQAELAEVARRLEEEERKKTEEQARLVAAQKRQKLENAIHTAIKEQMEIELKCPSTAQVHPSFTYNQQSYFDLSDFAQKKYHDCLGNQFLNQSQFYFVMGQVDAQNGFGAMIRASWYASICYLEESDAVLILTMLTI